MMSSELPSYEQAASIVAEHARNIPRPRTERIPLNESSSRILAASIDADDDQPPFARSTRDGYACRAAEASAHIPLPIAGATHAGQAPSGPLPAESAWEIMTGAPVPENADCVVMLEHVETVHDKKNTHSIRLLPPRTIDPGDNVVAKGAQARRGDEQLRSGVALGPAQIALAASCGYATVEVFRRPRAANLTTGDELAAIDSIPGPGKIRNSNAPMLAALVAKAGAEPIILPTAADTAEALDAALAQALEADMLLISGGVSAGKYDLVEPALARLGARFHFTGVKIQPGKPLVFGHILTALHERGMNPPLESCGDRDRTINSLPEICEVSGRDFSRAANPSKLLGALALETALPVFGLPGNPISSAATFLLFAAPLLAALSGSTETYPRFVLAHLSRDTDRKGKSGLTRFLPALCTFNASVHEFPEVTTVPWHGSGDLTAFARSNCFLVIPEDKGFLEAGSTVRILLH